MMRLQLHVILVFLYYYWWIIVLIIVIPLIIWFISKLIKSKTIIVGLGKGPERKDDYKNLEWLKYQYYDLGRSIQDIADDQGESMVLIRKWLDKLESPPEDLSDIE